MSQELEARVEALIGLEGEKKGTSKVQYQARKAFEKEYDAVFSMVESGHTMPKDSSYFAEIAAEEAGRVNHKYALDCFVETHPQYANTIRKLQDESKTQEVRRLKYGAS
ncbi:hypothetical protein GOV07_04170 [Candidatus Woesearchaeota archaeon]|nr:hypothetical protein [Candidatus Woesearchaeota archaeon]